jgi:hypothetical protein
VKQIVKNLTELPMNLMTTSIQAYDPAPFNERIPALTARLERLYEATRRAKRRLQNVKTAGQHVNYHQKNI